MDMQRIGDHAYAQLANILGPQAADVEEANALLIRQHDWSDPTAWTMGIVSSKTARIPWKNARCNNTWTIRGNVLAVTSKGRTSEWYLDQDGSLRKIDAKQQEDETQQIIEQLAAHGYTVVLLGPKDHFNSEIGDHNQIHLMPVKHHNGRKHHMMGIVHRGLFGSYVRRTYPYQGYARPNGVSRLMAIKRHYEEMMRETDRMTPAEAIARDIASKMHADGTRAPVPYRVTDIGGEPRFTASIEIAELQNDQQRKITKHHITYQQRMTHDIWDSQGWNDIRKAQEKEARILDETRAAGGQLCDQVTIWWNARFGESDEKKQSHSIGDTDYNAEFKSDQKVVTTRLTIRQGTHKMVLQGNRMWLGQPVPAAILDNLKGKPLSSVCQIPGLSDHIIITSYESDFDRNVVLRIKQPKKLHRVRDIQANGRSTWVDQHWPEIDWCNEQEAARND